MQKRSSTNTRSLVVRFNTGRGLVLLEDIQYEGDTFHGTSAVGLEDRLLDEDIHY